MTVLSNTEDDGRYRPKAKDEGTKCKGGTEYAEPERTGEVLKTVIDECMRCEIGGKKAGRL